MASNTLLCILAFVSHTSCISLRLPLKILQFADLHYGEAESLPWGPEQDANSTRVMRQVLSSENITSRSPCTSLLVYSGDQITGNNVGLNATAYSALIYAEGERGKIFFASIFGNHDDAPLDNNKGKDKRAAPRKLSTTSRMELLAFEKATFPTSLTCHGPDACPSSLLPSVSNYYLLVNDARTGLVPQAVLYFLDSGGGDFDEVLEASVTSWLANISSTLHTLYGPLPSITFVHIPPPEYAYSGPLKCVGMAEDGVTPTVGPNNLVSVLAATGLSRVISTGHDHGNAWCCPTRGMSMCYGRHTGYGGYGDWQRGSRVFELAEDATAPNGLSIHSHIRMEDGTVNSEESL